MNGLTEQARQLPNTLTELAKFVLIGREKLHAVRAEIRAIEKVQLAAEVHEQKLQEAQEIAEAVLDAETRLGELTKAMETAQGQRKDLELHPNGGTKSKKEKLQELGITHHERFEALASHPEEVEQAKADARADGKIVTRQDVLSRISDIQHEDRRQREARELREAKDRAKEYGTQEDKVVQIGEAKQNADDNRLIFEELKEIAYKAYMAVNQLAIHANMEIYTKPIKTASELDKTKLEQDIVDMHRMLYRVQKRLVEVIHEK